MSVRGRGVKGVAGEGTFFHIAPLLKFSELLLRRITSPASPLGFQAVVGHAGEDLEERKGPGGWVECHKGTKGSVDCAGTNWRRRGTSGRWPGRRSTSWMGSH